MPVLKDMQCQVCGWWREAIVAGETEAARLKCHGKCDAVTAHRSVCNGGTKSRWRFMDWGGVNDLDERVRVSRVEAVETDPETGAEVGPAADVHTGEVVHERPEFTDQDARAERRARIKAKHRRRKGKAPIFIDQKG